MKKNETNLLKQYAAKLPVELKLVRHSHKYSGQGLKKDGFDVDPAFDYKHTVPVAEPVNHYENMKRALLVGGPEHVGEYVKSVVDRYQSILDKNEQIIQEVALWHEIERVRRLNETRRRRWAGSWIGRATKFIKSIINKIKPS